MSYLNYIITFCWKYRGFKDQNKLILWECLDTALSCLLWLWYKDQNQTEQQVVLCVCILPQSSPFQCPEQCLGDSPMCDEWAGSPLPMTAPRICPAACCMQGSACQARPQGTRTNPQLPLPHKSQQCPSEWCSPTKCEQSSCSKCAIFMVSPL